MWDDRPGRSASSSRRAIRLDRHHYAEAWGRCTNLDDPARHRAPATSSASCSVRTPGRDRREASLMPRRVGVRRPASRRRAARRRPRRRRAQPWPHGDRPAGGGRAPRRRPHRRRRSMRGRARPVATWDAVYDVSGLRDGRRRQRHRRAARPRRRHGRPLRVRQLDHGLRPVAVGVVAVDRGPADRPSGAGDVRRLQGAAEAAMLERHRRTGSPSRSSGPPRSTDRRNNIYDMETPMFLRLAPAPADPAAAQRAGHRVVRSRRRPVRR